MFLTGVVSTSGRCNVGTVLSNIPDWGCGRCDVGVVLSNVPDWGCIYLRKLWRGNGIEQCSWLGLYLPLEGVMWERYWAMFLTGVVSTCGSCDLGTVLSNVPDCLTGVEPTSGRCDVGTVLCNVPDCLTGVEPTSGRCDVGTVLSNVPDCLTGVEPTSGRCDVGAVLSNVPDWGLYLPLEGVTWERYWAMFLTGVVVSCAHHWVRTQR